MTAQELEDWLKTEEAESSGWSKDDGSGESVGHERYVRTTVTITITTAPHLPTGSFLLICFVRPSC